MVPGSMPMRGPGGTRGGSMRGPMGRGDYGECLDVLVSLTHYIITKATITRVSGQGQFALARAASLLNYISLISVK